MISKSYTLDELCIFIRNGKSVKQSKDINGLPITRIETIANQTIDSDRVGYAGLTKEEGKSHLLECGDILFSHINSLEHLCKTAIYTGFPEKLVHGMNLLCIRPNPQLIFPQYLLHLLRSSRIRASLLQFANKSVNQASISAGNLKSFVVNIPPLAEQRRIAAILDQADELRQKRQQAIEKLDQLLQATFIDMFGDPLTNPKKWEMFRLGELTYKIQSGNTPKGGADNYIDKGITFIRSQNVLKNQMSLDDVVYISEKIHAQMKNSSLKHGDLLITKTGRINTENSSLGRAAIYWGEDNCANVNGHVYLMRLKENLNRIFILSIITSDSYYKYIRSVCVGVDKYQLNKEHLENFPIIQPSIELQNKFSDIVQVIESQKPKLLEQLDLAENLFKTLQQKAFNGTL